jgi:two-component system, OmpR family, response regulator ChvI
VHVLFDTGVTRILLVDDDEDHLMLFTMILEKRDFTSDIYSDPIAALSHFKPNYYDLAVLDYLMPNLNGLDLYKRLKDIDPSIRALFLTASHEELNEHENPRQDQLNFVGKPIAAEKLLWEIDSMLNQVTTPLLESTIIS